MQSCPIPFLLVVTILSGCTSHARNHPAPQVTNQCYRFSFQPWRSPRPGFSLDTLPRTFRLSGDGIKSLRGMSQFRAHLISGPTFGDYAPPIQPAWNRMTGDSAGLVVDISDPFFGVSLQVFGRDSILRGGAMIHSDELYQDSTGTFSTIVATASILAKLVECPR